MGACFFDKSVSSKAQQHTGTRNATLSQMKSSSIVGKLLVDWSLVLRKTKVARDAYTLRRNDGRRYEAVLRLSEALSVCTEPEDLTKILSEQLR